MIKNIKSTKLKACKSGITSKACGGALWLKMAPLDQEFIYEKIVIILL